MLQIVTSIFYIFKLNDSKDILLPILTRDSSKPHTAVILAFHLPETKIFHTLTVS